MTTYNWTISSFQERLVVNVHNGRQQILKNRQFTTAAAANFKYTLKCHVTSEQWHQEPQLTESVLPEPV